MFYLISDSVFEIIYCTLLMYFDCFRQAIIIKITKTSHCIVPLQMSDDPHNSCPLHYWGVFGFKSMVLHHGKVKDLVFGAADSALVIFELFAFSIFGATSLLIMGPSYLRKTIHMVYYLQPHYRTI